MSVGAVDWDLGPIDDLVTHQTEGVDPSNAEGLPYVGLEHIDPGEMSLDRWGDPMAVMSRKTRFQPGDILYGKLRPYLDKAVTASQPGICSTDILVLRPKPAVDPYFVASLLHTRRFLAHAMATTSGVNHPRTSWNAIRKFEAAIPPLSEQRTIAHVLRMVQRAKEATEQVVAASMVLKNSLMRHLLQHGPADMDGASRAVVRESPAGPIPKHWKSAELGEIARIERGKFSHRPRNDPGFYGGDVPFVQTGDVAEGGGRLTSYTQTLNEAGLAVSRVFPAGTILITIAANIGYVGILGFDSACPDSLIGITPMSHVSNEFLNYYLMTQQPVMDRLAPRGTQKNINIQFLRPWPVPLPPYEEQLSIVRILHAMDRRIFAETARRDALAALFHSLLHDLVTGRLRVPDLDLRPPA